ncbi:MAG: hypothetical protein ACAH83_11715 [Alphaproteobacteria bacterium]
MALPLTPSDTPDFQKDNPIKPEDEFIVMMNHPAYKAKQELTDVFNRHGRGQIAREVYDVFYVTDMTWPVLNELRARRDVRCCGPAKAKLAP